MATSTRTLTPSWMFNENTSWAPNKEDDNTYSGNNRWMSRRHFDWSAPESIAPVAETPTNFVSSLENYSDASNRDDGGYGSWSNAGADYGTSVSPETGRAKSAFYGGIKDYASQIGGTALGTSALANMMGAQVSPATIATGLISTSAPGFMGNLIGKTIGDTYGVESGWGTKALSTLAGFVNPGLGMLASAFGPMVSEGFGKLTGTRDDEGFKSAIENTLGTGFMDTAKTRANIKNYANMSMPKADVMSNDDGTVDTMGLSDREQAQANAIRAAWAAEISNSMQQSEPGKESYADMMARMSDEYGLGNADFASPVAANIRAYDDAVKALGSQVGLDSGWNGNPNSMHNPIGFETAAKNMGLDTSNLSRDMRAQYARDYNNSDPGIRGAMMDKVTDYARGQVMASAQGAINGGYQSGGFNDGGYGSHGAGISGMGGGWGGAGYTGGAVASAAAAQAAAAAKAAMASAISGSLGTGYSGYGDGPGDNSNSNSNNSSPSQGNAPGGWSGSATGGFGGSTGGEGT